ncbi:MAG: hypothetical protein JST32_10240 [Bacteroidetes bacterium]|nr:hypothetical protein [Bacteroidota bacterium]
MSRHEQIHQGGMVRDGTKWPYHAMHFVKPFVKEQASKIMESGCIFMS